MGGLVRGAPPAPVAVDPIAQRNLELTDSGEASGGASLSKRPNDHEYPKDHGADRGSPEEGKARAELAIVAEQDDAEDEHQHAQDPGVPSHLR